MTCVVDGTGTLLGIFTDGDLRRLLGERDSIRGLTVGEVMTRSPTSIPPDKLAVEAAEIFENKSLGGRLVVVDAANRLVGAVTFHDLLAARVV
jgi:arabinose-5-phosphate isomerase